MAYGGGGGFDSQISLVVYPWVLIGHITGGGRGGLVAPEAQGRIAWRTGPSGKLRVLAQKMARTIFQSMQFVPGSKSDIQERLLKRINERGRQR